MYKQLSLIILYLVAIVLANLSVTIFGPAVTIVNAFLLIGLDLSTRDKLHEQWQGKNLWRNMGLLILTGSFISWLLNKDAGPVALASMLAFGLSAIADATFYQWLNGYRWFYRSNGSNLVGAAVDSLVFPTLAFGTIMPGIIAGQYLAKVAGGLLWSVVLTQVKSENIDSKKVYGSDQ